MTPQELKASILQLVVQSKLVEQRPEEGTGEELYQQIQAEKRRLINAGTIKKEKPLPEITEDEIPFDIPDSWRWCRLNTLGITQTGNTPSKAHPEHTGADIPFITPGDILDGQMRYDNQALSLLGKEVARVCCAGTIMQVCIGGSIGKAAITNREVAFNQQINALSPIACSSEYIFAVMQSAYFVTTMKDRAGGTATPIINRGLWDSLLIPLPPLAEQKRIVAKLEEILPLIDRYDAAWSKLEDFNKRFPVDMQKSILQMAIQGKLVEQRPEEGTGEELFQHIQAEKQRLIKAGKLRKTKALSKITAEDIPTDFPESWKVCYIDDIAFVTKLAGFEYTKNVAPNLVSNGIPLFKGKNIQNGKLVLNFESYIPETVSDELPRSQILKKCLLTPYVGTIGNIAIFDGGFKAHLGSNVGKIELLNGLQEYVMEEYVLYYLRSTIGYDELTKYKKATAQESISIDAIRNVIIALPPLAEQKRIVAKLEEILPLCDRLK